MVHARLESVRDPTARRLVPRDRYRALLGNTPQRGGCGEPRGPPRSILGNGNGEVCQVRCCGNAQLLLVGFVAAGWRFAALVMVRLGELQRPPRWVGRGGPAGPSRSRSAPWSGARFEPGRGGCRTTSRTWRSSTSSHGWRRPSRGASPFTTLGSRRGRSSRRGGWTPAVRTTGSEVVRGDRRSRFGAVRLAGIPAPHSSGRGRPGTRCPPTLVRLRSATPGSDRAGRAPSAGTCSSAVVRRSSASRVGATRRGCGSRRSKALRLPNEGGRTRASPSPPGRATRARR